MGEADMVTYVDDMHKLELGRLGRMRMSHMIADSEEELHAMAERIGMKRAWYQGDHYDVAKGRRAAAIAAGAVEVPLRTLASMVSFRRKHGRLPAPEEAIAWRKRVADAAREGAGLPR
jgi:hypothetical protein